MYVCVHFNTKYLCGVNITENHQYDICDDTTSSQTARVVLYVVEIIEIFQKHLGII